MRPATPPAPIRLPDIPVGSPIHRVGFTLDEIESIAIELGQPLALAPFQVHGESVYRVIVPLLDGAVVRGEPVDVDPAYAGPVTTLTLWPSLRRVDATNPWATVVATGIVAVDLVPGVEAIFRHAGGSLTVARNGRVMVRTGLAPTAGDGSRAGESSR